MLDIKLIRENPGFVKKNLERRNNPTVLQIFDDLIKLDKEWRDIIREVNDLRSERNEISKKISELKKSKKSFKKFLTQAEKIAEKIKKLEGEQLTLEEKTIAMAMRLPNLLHESVPDGRDEEENVEIRKWGKAPKFDFQPKDHLEILKNLGLIEIDRGAKVVGHGFFYLKGDAAMLDMAILRYAIDFMQKKGFNVIEPPYMLRLEAMQAVEDFEFFRDQIYKIEGEDLYIIGTSEHSIAALFMNEVLETSDLPLTFAGVSTCFRKEVGAHGKYTKGLFRMHQFNKVEQFVIVTPDKSWHWMEKLQRTSEEIYQDLGIHHRVVTLCSGETGVKAAKTYDIEVWMADGKFRESGSNSNTTDWQSRRLNIKFRDKKGQASKGFVHMLNNTAIATSRAMVAILEQNQQEDGSVKIPKVLVPYMNGVEILEKK